MRDKVTTETVSTDHSFWRERTAEADSNCLPERFTARPKGPFTDLPCGWKKVNSQGTSLTPRDRFKLCSFLLSRRDKSMLATTKLLRLKVLLQQAYFCCDKRLVLSLHVFVATKISLSRPTRDSNQRKWRTRPLNPSGIAFDPASSLLKEGCRKPVLGVWSSSFFLFWASEFRTRINMFGSCSILTICPC